ncbi:TPA: ATP-dependent helicase [Candidatus Gracilibacteria bacterium]|nr:ATP-dependent helicase [Candidatus Gracilibacteria bacterium]HIQ57363.1 ATP-dependent helicase [Candidatus Gracilibacteria bacterium]
MLNSHNISFSKRLEKLNPEQRLAVETTEGPVMVVAGPGTGKTETLGARIANILHTQTDIAPGNILCLTYTNAGVVAMRKRLISFIGSSAHKIEIHTFHSFCNKIIQENTDYFPVQDAENISELSQYELMEKLLKNLPANDLHFQKNSYSYAKNLLGLFNTFKSESWEAQEVRDACALYVQELQNDENMQYKRKYTDKKTGKIFQKGDINEKKYKAIEEKIEKVVSATYLFEKYQKALSENGQYDFQDMITWVLNAFENDSNFLAEYQERFQYILVDEFQDTNGSQKELVDYLCNYWNEPNIFVVGDDDQSIYRFQGANMRNIMEYYNQYKKSIKVITLDKNYRSSQEILDVSSAIISKNEERLESEIPDLNKTLSSQHPRFTSENSIKPSIREYYNVLHEDLGIFKRIVALKKIFESEENSGKFSDIAVIYQNHSQSEMLIKLCEANGIPVRVKMTQNILELPIITQVIHYLEYFQKESQQIFSGESLLFSSFFFPFTTISGKEITHLALHRKLEMKKQETRDVYFKNLILSEEIFGEDSAFKKYGEVICDLEKSFHTNKILNFVEDIFNTTGILQWALSHSNKGFYLNALSTFFHFIKEEAQKKTDFAVSDVLDLLQRMKRHDLKISIEKAQYEKEGVNFITAHSSKGLEFEYVFIKGVNKKVWDSQQRKNYHLPTTLIQGNAGDFLEEKRRLFFVALTRAKKFVEVSYSKFDANGKELDTSTFISEMQTGDISEESIQYSEDEVNSLLEIEFLGNIEKKIEDIESSFLEPLLENYALSPTHLNKYLQCGKSFYFESLLQIPSSMSSSASFGNAIHKALEKSTKSAIISESKKYDLSVLIESFEKALLKEKYLYSDDEYEKLKKHGEEILPQYFNKYLRDTKLTHAIHTEKAVSTGIKCENITVPIKGKIDRIDYINATDVNVVDYKTGKPDSKWTKEKLLPPCEKNNELGGDYWRQMIFYAILLENNPIAPKILQSGYFDFVEPQKGEFHKEVISVTSEAKKKVLSQIESVYSSIQAGIFNECDDEECVWCG